MLRVTDMTLTKNQRECGAITPLRKEWLEIKARWDKAANSGDENLISMVALEVVPLLLKRQSLLIHLRVISNETH